MCKTFQRLVTSTIVIAAIVCLMAPAARADTWYGTAPFCNGQCPAGQSQIETSQCGNGACCWTGHKVLCQNVAPTCNGTQTNTACWGVVLICSNGYYTVQGSWTNCSTYACGICLGFPW